MKNNHTGGEWIINDAHATITNKIGTVICMIPAHIQESGASYTNESNRNMRLIAAAPTLLDTCQSALSSLKDMRQDATITGIIVVLEMAINKATS